MNKSLFTGITMLIFGAVLMAVFAAYHSYSSFAANHLNELIVTRDEAQDALIQNKHLEIGQILHTLEQDVFSKPDDAIETYNIEKLSTRESQVPDDELNISPTGSPDESLINPEPSEQFNTAILDNKLYYSVYPAFSIHPKYWGYPIWAGPESFINLSNELPNGFTRVSPNEEHFPVTAGKTRRIQIPIINVDSVVEDLEILDIGDNKAYSNPNNIVGKIPTSSTPGAIGNTWFFGHLESPLKGEGNVFRRLPELANYLRDGEPIFVSIESDLVIHLYQVKSTSVIHKDQLQLYGADKVTISLVSCVPRLVYDHRFVVTAELVGVKILPSP